jgi:hypothetical protein
MERAIMRERFAKIPTLKKRNMARHKTVNAKSRYPFNFRPAAICPRPGIKKEKIAWRIYSFTVKDNLLFRVFIFLEKK